jgi:hypothetical protein
MDPDACLDRLLDAVADRDPQALLEAAADLAQWLDRGGVPPRDPRTTRR